MLEILTKVSVFWCLDLFLEVFNLLVKHLLELFLVLIKSSLWGFPLVKAVKGNLATLFQNLLNGDNLRALLILLPIPWEQVRHLLRYGKLVEEIGPLDLLDILLWFLYDLLEPPINLNIEVFRNARSRVDHLLNVAMAHLVLVELVESPVHSIHRLLSHLDGFKHQAFYVLDVYILFVIDRVMSRMILIWLHEVILIQVSELI
jgi:hypothetical protein